MKLLEKITIEHDNAKKSIELFHGDLTEIPKEHSVDILIVSAFPNDYAPTSRSLIGALYRKGISVYDLAKNKAIDLRENFSCWLSNDIQNQNFRKVLCFEPYVRGLPSEVVGDIFQSLMPFVFANPPIKSIAMPLVASGDQNTSIDSIFEPLINAAVNWLMIGMPVTTIKIVERSEDKALELLKRFQILKEKFEHKQTDKQSDYKYDLFISYSHKNMNDIIFVEKELKRLKPDIKLFLDLRDLNTGSAWQQELYDALDDCKRVVAFLSEPYLTSKVCKEEFNIAVFRHRDSDEPVLLPVYLYSANLPTYMKLIQFIDCRESDKEKLSSACRQIIDFVEESKKFYSTNETKETQFCPVCGREVKISKDYPRYLCKECVKLLTDKNGREVYFIDEGIMLGYYTDSVKNEIYKSKICFANGVKCQAEELPSGGVVIQQLV